MFIELVDSLRCVVPHEDTWLVAAVVRMDGRHIVEGTLGCPVCRREYAITGGVAWFADRPSESGAPDRLTIFPAAHDEPRATRAAALLGLTEPGGIVLLGGSWAEFADATADLGAHHVVLLNAQASDASPQEVSALVVGDHVPLAVGTVRAAALGPDVATPARLTSAARVLSGRGRLVAPADAPVPEGVTVLARDARDWVGERDVVASPPVTIRSARR